MVLFDFEQASSAYSIRAFEKIPQLLFKLILVPFGLLFSSTAFSAGELYRYIGANGEVVIDHSIPPEFIPNGYVILNRHGAVIEKVAPELTAAQKAELVAKAKEIERQKKIKEEEAKLLQRFSDSGDAVLARDRQTGALETQIVVTQGTIKKLKLEEQLELERAAASERQGKEVPEDVLAHLERVRKQIRDAEQQIENQRAEQEEIRMRFAKDIQRLKEITGK